MERRSYEAMEVWRSGAKEIWGDGDAEIRDMGRWRYGAMEISRDGETERRERWWMLGADLLKIMRGMGSRAMRTPCLAAIFL